MATIAAGAWLSLTSWRRLGAGAPLAAPPMTRALLLASGFAKVAAHSHFASAFLPALSLLLNHITHCSSIVRLLHSAMHGHGCCDHCKQHWCEGKSSHSWGASSTPGRGGCNGGDTCLRSCHPRDVCGQDVGHEHHVSLYTSACSFVGGSGVHAPACLVKGLEAFALTLLVTAYCPRHKLVVAN